MGLTGLVGLLLAGPVQCVPRSVGLVPPPSAMFATLGEPSIRTASACPPGEALELVSRSPDALPPPSADNTELEDCRAQGCWAWAGWNDRRRMRGTAARLSVEAPRTSSPDHSLAEVSLHWGEQGEEIVEIGWEVAPRKYGDGDPHLFVHRFVGGRACGERCPFQRWSRRLAPGMSLGPWTGAELPLGWVLWQRRAWAWADGEWLGAFDLGSAVTPVAIAAQWFGEVFFLQPPPRVPMGNGRPAEDRGAARVREVCDVPEGAETCVVRPTRLPRVTRPATYGLRRDGPGAFRYGGPGETGLRPRPPPSSASAGTPRGTGTSAQSPPR
jgi:hypothetical protein